MSLTHNDSSLCYFAIQDQIREVAILILTGELGIGPKHYQINGFDMVVNGERASFLMELCTPYDP